MKKRRLCVAILAMIMLLYSCGASANKGEGSFTKTDSLVGGASGGGAMDTPCILKFDSFDKIAELREIVNKNNEEIESYLDSNGFRMNGLTSKEDVNNLFNQIGNLNILYLDDASGYNLVEILYYVSYGYIMSTYSNGNDIVRFLCYIDDGEISTDNNNMNTNSAIAGELTISGNVVSLYKVEDDSSYKLSGRFETSNSNITILFSTQEETNVVVENIQANVVVSTLLDLIK